MKKIILACSLFAGVFCFSSSALEARLNFSLGFNFMVPPRAYVAPAYVVRPAPVYYVAPAPRPVYVPQHCLQPVLVPAPYYYY